jgi:hypothetical protein
MNAARRERSPRTRLPTTAVSALDSDELQSLDSAVRRG